MEVGSLLKGLEAVGKLISGFERCHSILIFNV